MIEEEFKFDEKMVENLYTQEMNNYNTQDSLQNTRDGLENTRDGLEQELKWVSRDQPVDPYTLKTVGTEMSSS